MESGDIAKTIIKTLHPEISPYAILIFGSYGQNRTHDESDIDIAFLSKTKINAADIFFVAQRLAELLGKEVDLVDLSESSTVFQSQVISTGKLIYCNNPSLWNAFQIVVLKKYAKLNEERKVVLDAIVRDGSIYD